jgi:CRP-like cAMP-binding protein
MHTKARKGSFSIPDTVAKQLQAEHAGALMRHDEKKTAATRQKKPGQLQPLQQQVVPTNAGVSFAEAGNGTSFAQAAAEAVRTSLNDDAVRMDDSDREDKGDDARETKKDRHLLRSKTHTIAPEADTSNFFVNALNYHANDCPRWLLYWGAAVALCIILELAVIPYFEVFAPPSLTMKILEHAVSAVFVVDVLFVTWRMTNGQDRDPRTPLKRYVRKWMVPDIIVTIPWKQLFDQSSSSTGCSQWVCRMLSLVRLLRCTRARVSFPITAAFYHDLVQRRVLRPLPWTTKMTIFLSMVFLLVMHLTACGLGQIALFSAELGLESWRSSGAGGVDQDYSDVDSFTFYTWAFFWATSTFTTVGGLTAWNEYEARVHIFLTLFCSLGYSLCLAVFSTLVGTLYERHLRLSRRERSLQYYAIWRDLPGDVERVLYKAVEGREILELPDAPRVEQLAEYEKKLLDNVDPRLRQAVRMRVFGSMLDRAPYLFWLRGQRNAMHHVVAACEFKVVPSGHIFIEKGKRVKQILFVMAGTLVMEENEAEEEKPSHGLRNSDPFIGAPADERPRSTYVGGGHAGGPGITEERVATFSDLEAYEAWEDAIAAVEAVEIADASRSTYGSTVEDDNHLEKEIVTTVGSTVIIAPVIFGDDALWFDIRCPYTARAQTACEVLAVPVTQLLQVIKTDSHVRARYRAFSEFVFEEEAT